MISRKGFYNYNMISYKRLLHTKNGSTRRDLVIDVEDKEREVSTGSALPGDMSPYLVSVATGKTVEHPQPTVLFLWTDVI